MKILCFFFSLIICGLSLTVSAQDDAAHYKLRDLSAQQYMNGIVEIVPPDGGYDTVYFPQTVNETFSIIYPEFENEPWAKLLNVYDRLWIGEPDHNFSNHREQWNEAIVRGWLNDHQIDLSNYKQLQFEDYVIQVTPRDFNNDGDNEYVLDVVKGALQNLDRENCDYQAEYVDYLIAQGDKGNYEIIRPSLTWFSSLGGGPFFRGDGGAIELRFEDINADGLPEWIIAEGGEVGGGPGMGYSRAGELYIYTWRDGELKKLTPEFQDAKNVDETFTYYEDAGGGCKTLSNTVTWDFRNVDNDPALEILEHQTYIDNWYCESVVTKRFDWDASQDLYLYSSKEKTFDATENCDQRQAEEAMWKGDYQAATRLFERALTQPQYQFPFRGNEDRTTVEYITQYYNDRLIPLHQYLQARLALAYILTKQPEKAKPFLSALQSESLAEKATQQFVNAIAQYQDSPVQACIWAYTTFTQIYPKNYYGFTEDYIAPESLVYLPENIGCNAPKMVMQTFAQHPFRTDESLTGQIVALGINSQKYVRFDLNADGQDEWLIWLQSPMPPFFFTPDGDTYHVEQVKVNPYLVRGDITTWGLPDGAGKAVIFKTDDPYLDTPPWSGAYRGMDGFGGGSESCVTDDGKNSNFIPYRMWRMEGHTLEPILVAVLCRSVVKDLFTQSEGSSNLDGGRYKIDDGENPVVFEDIKYVWDSNEKIFKPVETPTPIATVISTPEPKYYSVFVAFKLRDFEAVLQMTEQISAPEYTQQYRAETAIEELTRDYYLRALALQHLGRDQEAIKAFLKMIEISPNEQWKQLAQMYLEPV